MPKAAYLEISALFEAHWTGIPTVVAAITQHALADTAADWHFIYETIEVPRSMVEEMLVTRNGSAAKKLLTDTIWEREPVSYAASRSGRAIFTNIKPARGLFAEEAMVVYDLSPIITPQFHHADTVNHFGNRFRADIETSRHFFPISIATRDDLETYFGIERDASTILPLGLEVDLFDLSLAQELARSSRIEPYVLVLGTLEPRKNGRLVLDFLARNPGFAQRFTVVFVGRDGWLDERERLVGLAETAGVARDRIVFTGYVTEQEKAGLLYNASFCIYASFFEGYGLPILEAAVLGKLVVCSSTSSMPEVSPDQCFFFNPDSVVEFARAMSLAEKRALQTRPSISLPDVAARLARHGWDRCYLAIRDWAYA